MQELKILIVEDDGAIYKDIYRRNIHLFNKENKEVQINDTWIQGKDEAISALKNPENIFDGAIVDLDLMGKGGTDTSGNEVVKEIKDNLRFPTFVITGTPHNISEELNVPNAIFDVYERDNVDVFDTFNRFKLIKSTGILNLLNRNGKIEELIQNIFWNHISTSLDSWVLDEKRNPEEKEDSLLRYTILHMLEYLNENNVHPSEFYITRPVKEKLSTGDLISWNGIRYVILTPACDFAQKKVTKAFLLRIKEISEEINGIDEIKSIDDLSKTKKQKLERIVKNNKDSYLFVPKHNSINAGVIDFQDKLSIEIEEIEERISSTEIDRFATISLPFLKDLIERYSSYYARQGSPDFDSDEVMDSLFKA
ncbi:response regulator [Flagellimonas sp. 389]|uniref:response regulator n=1 Tax=Flagellimonas sp. 389 TaxID=2835862 RepID=UPI001BD24BEF|nr:response regulator [Flagellimonas sp. 389]MBS9461030.1 response regulator [Flagellimonas sp. 389]